MLTRLLGGPQELLTSVRGSIELWANLLIISWAIAFMLWQGVGFAIALGTVVRHLGDTGGQSEPGGGLHGAAVGGAHRFLRHWRLHYSNSHLGGLIRPTAHRGHTHIRLAVLRSSARWCSPSGLGSRCGGCCGQPVPGTTSSSSSPLALP